MLLAGVYVGHALAPPAAHVAAPHELALAALHGPEDVGVVAAPAAQQVTALGALRRAVTLPALRPGDPQPLVLNTVIGRFVHVQQVLLPNGYFPLALLFPA